MTIGEPIGGKLEADLRDNPESYAEDLHEEMQNLSSKIKREMQIEQDALEKDEEMLKQLERMLSVYARYEADLEQFIMFIEQQDNDVDDMTAAMRFYKKANSGEVELKNDPTELPQVIKSIEEDFKDVFEKLKQKDEELEEVLGTDYDLEDEIEIIEHMATKLEKLTSGFESARNN